MRIAVTLVIDMTEEQVRQYAAEYGLPAAGGRLYSREVVEDVQRYVLGCVADSAAFGENGDGTRSASVSARARAERA